MTTRTVIGPTGQKAIDFTAEIFNGGPERLI
jgi:hypothetical protein